MPDWTRLRCTTCSAQILVPTQRVVFDDEGAALDASETVERPHSAWLRCPFHPSRTALLFRTDTRRARDLDALDVDIDADPAPADPRDGLGDGPGDGLDAVTLRRMRPLRPPNE